MSGEEHEADMETEGGQKMVNRRKRLMLYVLDGALCHDCMNNICKNDH